MNPQRRQSCDGRVSSADKPLALPPTQMPWAAPVALLP